MDLEMTKENYNNVIHLQYNYSNVRKDINAYILNLICRSRNIPIYVAIIAHLIILKRKRKISSTYNSN